MFPKFYTISTKNYTENLNYFELTNKKIKYCHRCIDKFKKFTTDYTSKLNNLFKGEKKSNLEDYEIIDVDDIRLKKSKTEKINEKNIDKNDDKKLDKKRYFLPIDKSLERLQNFFDDISLYLIEFTKELENIVKDMEEYLAITNSEISWIKDDYEKQNKIFESKYKQYETLNNKLKNKYEEGEKNLINFCLERRIDGIIIDNNVNISFNNIVQEESSILEQYNSLGDYEKIFYDSIKEKIKSLQDFISALFTKFDNNTKNIYNIFNNSFISKTKILIQEKNKKNKGENYETNLKQDLNLLLNKDDKNNIIDEKKLKLYLDEYNIKVLENSVIKKEEEKPQPILEEKKTLKISKKEKSNINKKDIKDNRDNRINSRECQKIVLTEDEIFFIVQNMYSEYQLINRNKYDIKIEQKKLELKEIIKKLINYDNKKDDNNNNKELNVKKEEIDYLLAEMKNEPYRNYFLLFLNNYRATGKLELSNKSFEYLSKIFLEISKYLYIIEKNKEKKEYINDYSSSRLIIIISQTFYTLKNGNKVYISEEIQNQEVFHKRKFWKDLIKNLLDSELKTALENNNKNDKEKINQLKNEIYLAHILPFTGSMKGFQIDKKEMKNIIGDLFKEYNVGDNVSSVILNTIDNFK